MKKILTTIGISILLLAKTNGQAVYANEQNVANNGYDVVNYFTNHSAVKGSHDFTATHAGATYHFVNAEHLDKFKGNPEHYLPEFDGYCAFAVAKMSKKAPVDPQTFRIDDGKLYLFFNDLWEGKPLNTIIPWINNEAEMEAAAAKNWVAITEETK